MLTENIKSLTKKQVRYRLYRIANGNPVDADDGLKEYIEAQDYFGGWDNFASTWDIKDDFGNNEWLPHVIDSCDFIAVNKEKTPDIDETLVVVQEQETETEQKPVHRKKDKKKVKKGEDKPWQFLKK